ncbi:sigma-54 dependent transcriptional regulator [Chitinophaga sp.]|uniref:sigma-54-dependent transcriptional regulator n=1 Tax=Chitinophaga sp. TaxID=1869181 RepID=UPI0031CDC1F9
MKILIVEDEFIVANDLRLMLQKAGYTVVGIASSVVQARKLIESKQPDWILIDIILKGDLTGIDLARELMTQRTPFLFISANTNQEILEAAKTTNPYGFLVKPFREKDLLVMLDIAFFRHEMEAKQQQPAMLPDTGMVGRSTAFANVLDHISKVAPGNTSVLITGESGTGKERVAAAIHRASSRSQQPMVTVNCAALPLSLVESELFGYERGAFTGANQQRIGKFEQANGGTVFLDEIGELPLEAQVKLLRVLQQREVERLGGQAIIPIDVRIITATNRNLEKEVAEGRFRLDLYYRLNVFPIEVPPLRDRKDDIEPLAYHFLEKFGKTVTKISPSVMRQMKEYAWPGNIRELEHLIERQVLLAEGPEITSIDLRSQPDITPVASSETIKTMEEMEKEHIIRALKASQGKVSGAGGAAAALGIAAQTLFAKMKKFGIKQTYQ